MFYTSKGSDLKTIYIDPAYKAYYQDRLFDESDPVLNRDGTLSPNIRLRDKLVTKGIAVHTADLLLSKPDCDQDADYYSFGVLDNYRTLASCSNISMRAFVIFEPPVVAPHLYRELPELTKVFDRVYIHNIVGDGYSMKDVDASKLHKFYWPQPNREVLNAFWNTSNRERRVVVINGNHRPVSPYNELYSARIQAMASLARSEAVDLYGRGWKRWWSRSSMWIPYWRHYRTIMSIYKGPCESKYEVLGRYAFALCFENMAMNGYVTEKIFDCFYAGTIPLYLGAPDITELIPQNAYIDVRKFKNWQELHQVVMSMSDNEIDAMRKAGKDFLQSERGLLFYNGLIPIFEK